MIMHVVNEMSNIMMITMMMMVVDMRIMIETILIGMMDISHERKLNKKHTISLSVITFLDSFLQFFFLNLLSFFYF